MTAVGSVRMKHCEGWSSGCMRDSKDRQGMQRVKRKGKRNGTAPAALTGVLNPRVSLMPEFGCFRARVRTTLCERD